MKSSVFSKVTYITIFSITNSVLNYVFHITIAKTFGVGLTTDTFFLAFSFTEWIMNIMTIIIPITIIPTVSGLIVQGKEARAWKLINTLLSILFLILSTIVLAVILLNHQIGEGVAKEFPEHARAIFKRELIFITPVVVFSSLSSVLIGVYYSYNRFLIPNISPIIQTAIMIFGVVFFHSTLGIFSAVYFVLIAAVVQFLFLAFGIGKLKLNVSLGIRNEDLRSIFKLMLPVLLGNIIFKSEVVINRYIATFLATGSISYLFYSSKIIRLGARTISNGIVTVIFPRLSKSDTLKDDKLFQQNFEININTVILFMFPMIGLILLCGKDLVYILFSSSKFDMEDVVNTTRAVIAHIGLLIAYPMGDCISNVFYAQKNTRTAVTVNLILFAPAIALRVLFMTLWGFVGIAVSSSIVGIVTIIILFLILTRKVTFLKYRGILVNLFQNFTSILVSFIATYVLLLVLPVSEYYANDNRLMIILSAFVALLVMMFLYVIINVLFKNEMVLNILRFFKKKRVSHESAGR